MVPLGKGDFWELKPQQHELQILPGILTAQEHFAWKKATSSAALRNLATLLGSTQQYGLINQQKFNASSKDNVQ